MQYKHIIFFWYALSEKLVQSLAVRHSHERCLQRNFRSPCDSAQYNLSFYFSYMAQWPDYFLKAEGPGDHLMGYSEIREPESSNLWMRDR